MKISFPCGCKIDCDEGSRAHDIISGESVVVIFKACGKHRNQIKEAYKETTTILK